MFNSRDSETPYINKPSKPFDEQMKDYIEWVKDHPERSLKNYIEKYGIKNIFNIKK